MLKAALSTACLVAAQAAIACSPLAPPVGYVKPPLPDFAANSYSLASHVADIRVISVTPNVEKMLRTIRYETLKSYKGSLPVTGAMQQTMSVCDHMFELFEANETTMVFLSDSFSSVYVQDPYLPYSKRDVANYFRQTKLERDAK